MGDFNFENVENFVCQEVNIAKNSNGKDELQRRVMMANKSYYSILWIMKSERAHRKNKLEDHNTTCASVQQWSMDSNAGIKGFH